MSLTIYFIFFIIPFHLTWHWDFYHKKNKNDEIFYLKKFFCNICSISIHEKILFSVFSCGITTRRVACVFNQKLSIKYSFISSSWYFTWTRHHGNFFRKKKKLQKCCSKKLRRFDTIYLILYLKISICYLLWGHE